MKQLNSPVEYNQAIGGDYFRLGLRTGLSSFVPGQFGMLAVPGQQGVLLRRPFSLARQQGDVTEILYKVVGQGTKNLSTVLKGQSLSLLAPLGKGFSMDFSKGTDPTYVAVAGGYGVAPFWELAVQLKAKGQRLKLCYGARSKDDLMYLDELKALDVEMHLTTEDGSAGTQGRVTDVLQKIFQQETHIQVWSCGPMGMLKAVGRLGEAHQVSCELSVEEAMGCGTGVCLACVVEDRQGQYRRACKEGPVFASEALQLEA